MGAFTRTGGTAPSRRIWDGVAVAAARYKHQLLRAAHPTGIVSHITSQREPRLDGD